MVSFDSTDLDNASSESGVVHQSVANTDHTDASELKQGYDYANFSEITPTPVACYPLHEDSGSTAYDKAGTNDGTVNGATMGAEGLLGTTSYSFDGVDDGVIQDGVPDVGNTFTLMAWTAVSEWPPSDNFAILAINGNQGTQRGYKIIIQEDGSGNIRANLADGSVSYTAGSYTPPIGVWNQYAATYDGVTLRFYVNGMEKASTSPNATSYTTSKFTTGFGVNSSSNAKDYWAGNIADVRFYDHALTASEVQTLYDVVATQGTLTTQYKPV